MASDQRAAKRRAERTGSKNNKGSTADVQKAENTTEGIFIAIQRDEARTNAAVIAIVPQGDVRVDEMDTLLRKGRKFLSTQLELDE